VEARISPSRAAHEPRAGELGERTGRRPLEQRRKLLEPIGRLELAVERPVPRDPAGHVADPAIRPRRRPEPTAAMLTRAHARERNAHGLRHLPLVAYVGSGG
jgi:hypothetical protein